MKHQLTIAVLLLACTMPLPARQLKAADGGKVIEAEFVRYVASRDMVTLKANGRDMVVSAAKFSEEDRNYFIEAQQEIDKKQALRVKTVPNNNDTKETHGQTVFSYRAASHKFEVTNTSESYIEGLELRYWTVLELHNRKTRESQIKINSDRKKLGTLPGGSSETVESPSVKLTLGAKSIDNCKCPGARAAAAAKAGAIQRDRVLGTKVELVDASGNVLYSEASSNRVESLLAKKSD
jgi:hypothetical protein